jgi:hypothetical protein
VAVPEDEQRSGREQDREELRGRDALEPPVARPEVLEQESDDGVPDEEDQQQVTLAVPGWTAPREPDQDRGAEESPD